MSELIDEGRIAAGWTKTGPGCWRGPNRNILSVDLGTLGTSITISMETSK
jgi:hypothetical protein